MKTEVIDVGLTNHVKRSRYAVKNDQPLEDASCQEDIPEDVMAKIEEYLGDGLATVSVSADLGESDYGNKSGCIVSVRVTCGNNDSDILSTHRVVKALVQKLVSEDFDEMQKLLQKKKSPKRPTEKAPVSQRPAAVSTPATRPPVRSFRR